MSAASPRHIRATRCAGGIVVMVVPALRGLASRIPWTLAGTIGQMLESLTGSRPSAWDAAICSVLLGFVGSVGWPHSGFA